MKFGKVILSLVVIFWIVGCGKNVHVEEEVISDNLREEVSEKDEYVDDNPIEVGFYRYYGSSRERELLISYETSFENLVDIGSFEVFFTRDSFISGGQFQEVWKDYYNRYEGIDNYKIGFHISFGVSNGEVYSRNILSVSDIKDFVYYVQVYLYDDVNQEVGTFYSHLEAIEEDTIISSIKVTGGTAVSEVITPITLTVFTYNGEDDFDSETSQYRGNSSYTILINNSLEG